jgi:hypothetical protein
MILGLVVVTLGLFSIGWSVRELLTGAAEWRPGARVDSMLLAGAVTTMTLSGLCLIPAPDASAAVPRWRKGLGLLALGVSVVLFVWHVARMG